MRRGEPLGVSPGGVNGFYNETAQNLVERREAGLKIEVSRWMHTANPAA
jgi:hypothetical protein